MKVGRKEVQKMEMLPWKLFEYIDSVNWSIHFYDHLLWPKSLRNGDPDLWFVSLKLRGEWELLLWLQSKNFITLVYICLMSAWNFHSYGMQKITSSWCTRLHNIPYSHLCVCVSAPTCKIIDLLGMLLTSTNWMIRSSRKKKTKIQENISITK